MRRAAIVVLVIFISVVAGRAQSANDTCVEAGITPALDSPFSHIPYVFGRVTVMGLAAGQKKPKVVVVFAEGQGMAERQHLSESGNFCFKRRGNTGTLVVEVDGIEAGRRQLAVTSAVQQQEDFEVSSSASQVKTPPAVVSAKFSHPQNEKTAELYKKAAEAQSTKDLPKGIEYLKQIVAIDAIDFIAWARLGALYFEQKNLAEAEAAFRKSLANKVEYTTAWIYMSQIRTEQKQVAAAIEILKHAVELDPKSALAFRLLGEAYLQSKQGTLGVAALNEAIAIDPRGMAECHLQIAHLYELAGAKPLAAKEYKTFLEKVPEYANKKRLEKFIKENP